MHAIKIVITLNSPLLIARPENGDENSRISLDYIPGSTIKGVVIKKYLKLKCDSYSDDLMQNPDSEIRKLFFSDDIQFLNGYLYSDNIPSAPRALPTPASWYIEKVDKEEQNIHRQIWDFALERHELNQAKTEPRRYFWCFHEENGNNIRQYSLGSTDFMTMVHNASTDPHKKGRGTSTVFRYKLINSGQSFCAYVVVKEERELESLFSLIPEGKVWLGASSQAGYGETNFSKEKVLNWKEYQPQQSFNESEISFTLLSDLIIKDDSGEPSLDFGIALKAHLGLPKKPEPVYGFLKSGIIGGFNRKWGLPTIQHRVIQKGSCFVYKQEDLLSLTPDKIRCFVEMGVGEHRSDGFGRIAVNLNSLPSFKSSTRKEPIPLVVPLTPASNSLVKHMIKKRLSKKVDNAILMYVKQVNIGEPCPENSQLQRLRNFVNHARSTLEKTRTFDITSFLDGVNKKEDAYLQFDRRFLEVKGKRISWLKWLEEVWETDIIDILKLSESDWTFFDVVDIPDDDSKKTIKYRLIDSVAQKAIKTRSL